MSKFTLFGRSIDGIALIQILLLTSIMSVLALYLTVTSREQVTIANWSNDKTEAYLNRVSAESEVYYSLLTKPLILTQESDKQPSNIMEKWNFHGKAFLLNADVKVEIQDQGGLINARYPKPEIFTSFVQSLGISYEQSRQLLDVLLDWQDVDSIPRASGKERGFISNSVKNGKLVSLSELSWLQEIPVELKAQLLKNLTVYRMNNFNPMNSSVELLAAITDESTAMHVDSLRESKQLTPSIFRELTGISEDDGYYFSPSKYFGITIISKRNDAVSIVSTNVDISPNSVNATPINTLYWKEF